MYSNLRGMEKSNMISVGIFEHIFKQLCGKIKRLQGCCKSSDSDLQNINVFDQLTIVLIMTKVRPPQKDARVAMSRLVQYHLLERLRVFGAKVKIFCVEEHSEFEESDDDGPDEIPLPPKGYGQHQRQSVSAEAPCGTASC
eukprot:611290-Amphidinium_carterae.1